MSSSPTQVEIARRLKLSQQSVSAALRGLPEVSERTRQKVMRVAEELGYRPNAAARATATGRFRAIGLLSRGGMGSVQDNLMSGALAELDQHGMHLTYANLPLSDVGQAQDLPRVLNELCVDGLLVHQTDRISPDIVALLQRQGLPVIWVNVLQEYDCIYEDNFEAFHRATRTLLGLGHRRPALMVAEGYVSVPPQGTLQEDRDRGYRQAMEEAGREPWLLPHPYVPITQWPANVEAERRHLAELTQLLRRPDRPTAIITLDPHEAARTLLAAAALGLRVPQDLSLITAHQYRFTRVGVSVSTLTLPLRELGRLGVQMLLEKIRDPRNRIPARTVRFEDIRPDSLAPAPAA